MIRYFAPTKLSDNIHETPEGFLICYDVLIGRTGEMTYGEGESPIKPGDDGSVIVTRDANELFNKDTIASFEGKAFTIKHPEEFVDPENWSRLAKGVIQNVRRGKTKDDDGEESLIADILVTDQLAIQLVKSGMREVSCGYEAIYEETAPGRGRQTDIIGNHLALVDQGRAGPSYAIMDSIENSIKERLQMSQLKMKMKELFSKAIDEATEAPKVISDEKEEKSKDEKAYDELVKMFKDLNDKIDSIMPKGKDAGGTLGEAIGYPKDKDKEKEEDADMPEKKDKEDTGDKEEEEKGKDADVSPQLEDRLKAIEAAVTKLMEMATKENGDEADDPEEMGDEEEDKDKNKKTGDSKFKTGLEKTKAPFEIGDSKNKIVSADKLNELNKAFWSRSK